MSVSTFKALIASTERASNFFSEHCFQIEFIQLLPFVDEAAGVAVVVGLDTISSNILGASFRKYSLRFGPLISYQQIV